MIVTTGTLIGALGAAIRRRAGCSSSATVDPMRPSELADYCRKLRSQVRTKGNSTAAVVATQQLVLDKFGETSAFYRLVKNDSPWSIDAHNKAEDVLTSIVDFVENGLLGGVSLQRQAQADVLADILDQAAVLLDDESFHPATGAMLVGAALEQFLRSWVEERTLTLGPGSDGIDKYAKALRAENLIDKNDKKDIDSWAGVRNDAAHGQWDKVGRERARNMLAGVGLFVRQHGADVRGRPPRS